ncbi:MAG: membrane protein insertase YidC [Candidatus Orphnella occulta]|nr:membrane protein insertase YidC [Candidatus Orphnella occulta]
MNNEKRLFLAIGLSVLVILGYQAYMKKHVKPYHAQNINDTVLQPEQEKIASSTIEIEKVIDRPVAVKAATDKTTTLENDVFTAVFTDDGAAIKELYLMQYIDAAGAPTRLSGPIEQAPYLLSIQNSKEQKRQWGVVSKDSKHIKYKSTLGGVEVIKVFNFYKTKHIIGLELMFRNTTKKRMTMSYALNGGTAEANNGYLDSRYIGADILADGKVLRKRPSGKTITDGITVTGSPVWVSAHDRYFSFVLKPDQQEEGAIVKSSSKKNIWSSIVSMPVTLEPGQVATRSYVQYAGPSDIDAISELGASANNVISYGFFHPVAKVLFKALRMFHRITGNYGLSIILLSLTISLIMMPLTRKSLHSMKAMQAIQPETEQIRKAYSDNPQKMNKEIMGLYKKNKINPVGGCLPMLLQLPIFMSLYQVLLRSVALRGAHFLWIKDLAGPDAAFTLPQKLPIIGSHINILPILMAIAMWAQQKISQGGGKEVSEQQKMMATIMPVMFGFIFYNMPSGLVLYWFTNTLFMLLIQEVVLKARKPITS